jgi:hypothetical protein
MAEWLRLLTSNHFALHCCEFDNQQGLWILSCEEAIQLAYRNVHDSTKVPVEPEIMLGMALEVFIHQ